MDAPAHPPETIEGWYVLHQLWSIDRTAVRGLTSADRLSMVEEVTRALGGDALDGADGWTVAVDVIGSRADFMLIHTRSSLDEIGVVQRRVAELRATALLHPVYSFLSVTEAGLYHLTAELARTHTVGDEAYRAELAKRVESERASAHVRRRLYPDLPAEMPYVCFYPMSKRRDAGQNWYTLSLDERSRLMRTHGETGRRYAGRILQIISGAIGLDAWEWGVTLFARDPLDFKKLVTDMRFDEVSARYADFGDFYVGKRTEPWAWLTSSADAH